MLNGYSQPMPKVMGSAMKFKKLSFEWRSAAPPTVSSTAQTRDTSTASPPRTFAVAIRTTRTTPANDASVARGPSRSIERIISAKIVDRLAVATVVPSGRTTLSVLFAIRSML